tara:strand:+ start:193 stop:1200 length:1008 start_codon:yes stop_codon:yes gene_type:complete
MVKQVLNKGSSANDGTGDTLRQGAQKINDNFDEVYAILGADSANNFNLTDVVKFSATGVEFEGDSANGFETTLTVINPTADRTITLPNATGTVTLNASTQTLTNKTLTSPIVNSPVLTTPQINDTSADHKYVVAVSELVADRNITLPLLTGNDEFTFNAHAQTLTNKTLTSPKIGTSITDVVGNSLIDVVATSSANNHLKLTNAANGDSPILESTGVDDDNVALKLGSKGTSAVEITTPFVLGHETIANPNLITLSKTTTIFTNTTGLSHSLPDGNTIGQIKIMLKSDTSASTTINQTSSNFAFGSSIAFAANQSATLIWSGTKWFIISNTGTVA